MTLHAPQSALPFYYMQFTQIATVTTQALSAAPLIIQTVIIPILQLTDGTGSVWFEGAGLQYDFMTTAGVETVVAGVQYSLDGGTTWTALVTGSGTSAIFKTNNPALGGAIKVQATTTSFRLRLMVYESAGVETASVKNLTCKFIMHTLS